MQPTSMATYGTFDGSRSGRPTRDEQMRMRQKLEDDAERDTQWPVWALNTVLNVCPQGHVMVVERFGALHEIRQPGTSSLWIDCTIRTNGANKVSLVIKAPSGQSPSWITLHTWFVLCFHGWPCIIILTSVG